MNERDDSSRPLARNHDTRDHDTRDPALGHRTTESVALIEALYTLSDITAEINGCAPQAPQGLNDPDDIGLIDDIIDALQDRRHRDFARRALRDAVARIARHGLPGGPTRER